VDELESCAHLPNLLKCEKKRPKKTTTEHATIVLATIRALMTILIGNTWESTRAKVLLVDFCFQGFVSHEKHLYHEEKLLAMSRGLIRGKIFKVYLL
jgi:hypothetical protein